MLEKIINNVKQGKFCAILKCFLNLCNQKIYFHHFLSSQIEFYEEKTLRAEKNCLQVVCIFPLLNPSLK